MGQVPDLPAANSYDNDKVNGLGVRKANLARLGAMQGLLAWIAYWLVESFFLHLRPWLLQPPEEYMPSHAGFTAALLGIYAVCGLLTGALAGIIVASWSAPRSHDLDASRTGLAATLFLAFLLSLSVFLRPPWELPLRYLALVLLPIGLSFAISLRFPPWSNRLAFLTNPWTVTAFLLAPPFLFDGTEGRLSPSAGAISFLPWAGAAILISFLIPLRSFKPRSVVPLTLASALVLAACFLVHRIPRVTPPRTSAALSPNAPNMILITLDTVRADHLSLFGYERDTTPNLKTLAREATVYTNAIAPGNMTLSSHASIFTGLYPSSHHAHLERNHALPLDPDCPTLAGILSAKGFDTVGVVANYTFLAHGFGLDRGFTYVDSEPQVPTLGGTSSFSLRDDVRKFFSYLGDPPRLKATFRPAEAINTAALAAVDRESSQNHKFFLFLNYMDAHWPYLPPGRFATLYPGRDRDLRYSTSEQQVLSQKRPLSDHERQAYISQYDGGIAYMDWCLGQFIAQLKQRGLYDNTLLIVASDHGEAFGERNLLGHALAVYQDEIHVPLLIKYPHSTTGAVIAEPVSLVDIMPTILDAQGYEIPPGIQGRSLLRPAGATRDIFSEGFATSTNTRFSKRFRGVQQAIFSGPMKFIEWSTGNKEFYDLSQDPDELHNLLPAGSAAALESKLAAFRQAAAQNHAPLPQIGKKALENLKSVGYLQ